MSARNQGTAAAMAASLHKCAQQPLPPGVVRDTHLALADIGGCMALGSLEPPYEAVRRYALTSGGGTALTWRARALILGTAAHACELDSFDLRSLVHADAVVIPAVTALADDQTSEPRAVAAIALGREVSIRVGDSLCSHLNDGAFDRGFHPTSVAGSVGACAAASIVLELDEPRTADALAIAADLSGGLLEANRTGGLVKAFHAGWAAALGCEAALLARAGLTGAPSVFDGRMGFLRAFAGEVGDALQPPDGIEWRCLDTTTKPYATNGFTHPAIECATLARDGLDSDERVERVLLAVPSQTLKSIAEPAEAKKTPGTIHEARCSVHYLVGSVLSGSGVSPKTPVSGEWEPRREALDIAQKVAVVSDPACTRRWPQALSCSLVVETNKRRLECSVQESLGTRNRPLGESARAARFVDPRLPRAVQERLSTLLYTPRIHHCFDLARLLLEVGMDTQHA